MHHPFTHTHNVDVTTNLIVAWNIVDKALEVVSLPITVPHCPVKMGLDALSYRKWYHKDSCIIHAQVCTLVNKLWKPGCSFVSHSSLRDLEHLLCYILRP